MTNYDLAIIGAGPSGLAAAVYALNSHINVALIAPDLGGKVSYGFELRDRPPMDSVWGAEMVHQFVEQIQAHPYCHIKEGIRQIERDDGGIFHLTLVGAQDVERTVRSKSILIATGAQPQQLYIPGEKEFWGRGVSFSAISHAQFFENKDVMIIGRGDRALVATLEVASIAAQVYFVPTVALNANQEQAIQARNQGNIKILAGWEVQQINGDEYVASVSIGKGYDLESVPVEGVFVELGLLPNVEFARGVATIDSLSGRIPIDQRCRTDVPGLFAAGDVTNIYAEQVPIAIGEGIKAAISAWEYLVLEK